MESRKDQLQKQIIEAMKANESELYSLLKSQWAHRFGVESLEELKKLDLNELDQKQINVDLDNQKKDQSIEDSFDADKTISLIDDGHKEKEIQNENLNSFIDKNTQGSKIKSYEIADNKNKGINQAKDNKNHDEIKALIPLPPKPKYSYLKKWLLKN